MEDAYNYVYKQLMLELYRLKGDFPLTIVYCKLQWCAYGVELATRLLGQNFLTGATLPCVVQYHSQQPAEVNFYLVYSGHCCFVQDIYTRSMIYLIVVNYHVSYLVHQTRLMYICSFCKIDDSG